MTRPSKARVLIEIERRYGTAPDGVEPSLYGAYLLEGGKAGDDKAFEAFIDQQDDIEALAEEVSAALDSPTRAATTSDTPSGGSSPLSVATTG